MGPSPLSRFDRRARSGRSVPGRSLGAGADLLAVELLEGVVVGDGVAAALALDGLDRGLGGLDRGLGGLQLLGDQEGDETGDRAEEDEHAGDDEERAPGRQPERLQAGRGREEQHDPGRQQEEQQHGGHRGDDADLDRRHIWNVIYNARSNRYHDPTSPNTAPARQSDSYAWSLSHMKRHLQCAE